MKCWIAAFSIALISLADLASAQVRVLHETFAGPTFNPAVSPMKCTPVMVGGEPAAECNWDGVRPWDDPLKYRDMAVTAPGTGAMLVRVEVLFDPDIDIADGSKLFRFGPTGTVNWDFFAVCQFWKGTGPGGADILISDGARTMWGRDGSWRPLGNVDCYQRGVWYQLAVYIDATVVRFFWNGQLIQEFPAVAGKPYPLTGDGRKFYMPSNWSSNAGWEHDASNRTRWRRLEIFTQSGAGQAITGSLRDNTATVGSTTTPPTNCVPGTPSLVSTVTSPECVNGNRTVTETWTRVGDVPATNGGAACSPIPYTVTRAEPCVAPPVETLTVLATTTRCLLSVTLNNAVPPDATGWRMQLQRRRLSTASWTSHGTVISAEPFTRTATVDAGAWEVRGLWTRSGFTSVPTASVLSVACE